MENAEFLILHYAVELWMRPQWIKDINVQDYLNKPFHNLNEDALLSLLDEMFQQGDLIGRYNKGDYYEYSTPTKQEIKQAINVRSLQDSLFYYGLTEQGGLKWERLAKANWDKYIYESFGEYHPSGPHTMPLDGEIISSSKTATANKLAMTKHFQQPFYRILPETEVWDTIEPWHATYWKILPIGHRVSFVYTDEEPSKNINDDEYWKQYHETQDWYTYP